MVVAVKAVAQVTSKALDGGLPRQRHLFESLPSFSRTLGKKGHCILPSSMCGLVRAAPGSPWARRRPDVICSDEIADPSPPVAVKQQLEL